MMMNLILCRGIPARVNKGWRGSHRARNRSGAGLRKVFWETRAFSICAQETKMRARKPNETNLKPPAFASPNLNSSGKKRMAILSSGLRSAAPHLYSALLTWPTWWFDESYFSRCSSMSIWIIFCVSLCVFLSRKPLTVSRDISVDSKPVFWRLCPWMWQSRGACLCNMVLTFASLFGCIVRQG